jgi:hypothetical protein
MLQAKTAIKTWLKLKLKTTFFNPSHLTFLIKCNGPRPDTISFRTFWSGRNRVRNNHGIRIQDRIRP